MVTATERNSEFVADLSCHRPVLRKTKMMGVSGTPAAYQTRLLRHKLDVFAITHTAHFRQLQLAFVYLLRLRSLLRCPGSGDGRVQRLRVALGCVA